MVSNLKPLKELVTIKGGKRLPKGEVLQTVENNHPYIRVRDMGNRYIPRRGLEYVPEDVFPKISRYIVKENDVIISIVGTVGLVSIIDKRFHHASQTENCAKLSGLSKEDAKYLYYYLISSSGKQEISTYTVGAVQPKLPLYGLESISVPWFDESKRKAIAHILGSLDDKIELNLQMNETLEAMAQAFFKSWFVDFDPVIDNALEAGNSIPDELFERAEQRKTIKKNDNGDNRVFCSLFPDEFEFNEEVGWIPKGWCVKRINDLVESVSITYPLKTVDKVIFLNTGDILDGKVLHQNYSDVSGLPGQAKKSIKKDDILYSEIRPKNKRYAYVNFEASNYVVSTKLMVLRSISNIKSIFSYFYLKQENIISNLQFMAEARSGTFPQITFDVLSKLTLTLPNETALIDYFTAQVLEPYHHKIYKNEENSEKLSELRDTLLPKLMSGEIRIPEAAALVENA